MRPGVSNRRRTLGVGDVVGGRFRLEAELGEGGMSRVYEAVDLKYQRAAAVKVLARWLAEDEEFRHRFERESLAAERVTHPHVLPIWDHGDENGLLYLATPLCDLDVGDLIGDRGRLDVDRALMIIAQVAWALDWAHGRGVVHRDVKPENVLLVTGPDSEHAYLADFGLARARVDETLTQAGHPPGLTPAYAAPEQWRGEAIGPAADQYALAATLFTCVSGHPPFHPRRGPSLRDAHLSESPPDLDGVVEGVPEALAEAVARGLAKEPSQRFGTCRELVAAAQAGLQRARRSSLRPRPGEPRPPDPDLALAETQISEPGRPPGAAAPPPREEAPTPTPSPPPATPAPAAVSPTPPGARPAPAAAAGTPPPLAATPASAAAAGTPPSAAATPASAAAAPSPAVASPSPAAVRPSAVRRPIVLGAVGVVVAGAIAVVLLLGSGGDGTPSRPAAAAVQRLTVGSAPRSIAAGTGGVWVANSGAATLSRIAPRRGAIHQAAVRAVPRPFGVAVDEARLWVVGPSGELASLDARTGRRLRTAELGGQADGLAAGFGALWVINATAGTVTRIDVSDGRVGARHTVWVGNGTTDVAAGAEGVWVTNSSSATAVQLHPRTGAKLRTVRLRGLVGGVALDAGGVWVANPGRGRLVRIDPEGGPTRSIRLGPTSHTADVAAGDGAVFYLDGETGNATRVDPRSRRRVGSPVRVAADPGGAVVAARSLWVTDTGRGTVTRLRF